MKLENDYINCHTCWRDLYAKSSFNLLEEQCVKQIIWNFDLKIRGWIIIYCGNIFIEMSHRDKN